MAHWKAVWHVEGIVPTPEQTQCCDWEEDAASWLLRVMWRQRDEYLEKHETNQDGHLLVTNGFTLEPVSWAEAAEALGNGADEAETVTFEALKDYHPAKWLGMGPCIEILGVNYAVEGCDGTDHEVAPASEKTYTAVDGHRYVARLKHHPRTGEIIRDYQGKPEYSQWDSSHSVDCPCQASEEGSDWDAIQQWESGDDY